MRINVQARRHDRSLQRPGALDIRLTVACSGSGYLVASPGKASNFDGCKGERQRLDIHGRALREQYSGEEYAYDARLKEARLRSRLQHPQRSSALRRPCLSKCEPAAELDLCAAQAFDTTGVGCAGELASRYGDRTRMTPTRELSTWISVPLGVFVGLTFLVHVAGLLPSLDRARRGAAKAQVKLLSDRLQRHAQDHGRLPATLLELTQSPGDEWPRLQEKDLIDPYGHSLVYVPGGAHGAFDLICLGKDGKPGGVGYDADFGNRDLSKTR